jgi:hypothetical protein
VNYAQLEVIFKVFIIECYLISNKNLKKL